MLYLFRPFLIATLIILSFSILANDKNDKKNLLEKEILEIKRILEISINSSINPATFNFIETAHKKAQAENFNAVLIKLNTPGGLVSTTKDIMTLMGDSPIPTFVWIFPEGASATSAGAIIASSAHVLVMSNGTNIGAATPIEMGGDIEKKDLKAKAINDLVALVQSLSETRGRNAEAFGKMIKEASSYKAIESKTTKLSDGIASSYHDLFKILENKEIKIKGQLKVLKPIYPEITTLEMDFGQALLNIFANPQMAYILFIIGAALLYFEFQAPGGFIAGSIGVVALILSGIGLQVLPLNFGALILMALSFILFLLEFYIPSHGIISIAGVISLTIGSLFLFRTKDSYMEFSNTLVFSTVAGVVVFLVFVAIFWAQDAKKRLKNQTSFFSKKDQSAIIIQEIASEEEGLYFYQIKIKGEIWKAKSTTKHTLNSVVKIINHNHDSMIVEI